MERKNKVNEKWGEEMDGNEGMNIKAKNEWKYDWEWM